MAHPDSVRAFARFEAARSAGASSSIPPVEWFASRLKHRAAARATHLAEASLRRPTVERTATRGPMPDVLVVETAGYETARDNPPTVVVDHERRCLRRDRLRLDMRSEQAFRLVEFMLTHRDQDSVEQARAADIARAGLPRACDSHTTHLISQANRALGPLGLRVESIWGGTLRLVALEGRAS